MDQNPSHSNMPEFGHTPSTGILYQQPPSSEQLSQANKRARAKAGVIDVIAAVVLIATIGSVPFMVQSCSEDADHQAQQAVKFQMEVGND